MMNNKCILPSIGMEGSQEELLKFISEFEFNKIGISFFKNKMVLTAVVPVSDELMEIYKEAYRLK